MTFSGFRFLKEKACLKVRERAKKKRLKQSKFLITLPTDYTHGPWKTKRARRQGESLFSQVWKSNHLNFQGDRLSIRDKPTKFWPYNACGLVWAFPPQITAMEWAGEEHWGILFSSVEFCFGSPFRDAFHCHFNIDHKGSEYIFWWQGLNAIIF